MASNEAASMNGAISNHVTASNGIDGSIIRAESVRAICDQFAANDQNTPLLDLSLCEAVAAEVEYRIRQIAQDALKFMSASCRTRMTCADIDSALRLRNVPALYGFRNSSSSTFCSVAGYDDLFFVNDPVLSLSNILTAPLPAAPADSTFSVHWLAVQGIQPCIPQNPAPILAAPPIHEKDDKSAPSTVVRPPVRHVLSKEQQMYYDQVTLGIRSGDESLERAVLQSVSRDPGLHQLLPYLVQFVADQVNAHLRDLPQLWSVMRLAQALIYSPHLRIEPYLHQIMPPILTCLVGRHLCYDCTQDHWALRDYAAGLVAYICRKFGSSYQTLQPRVSKTLAKAFLDPDRPLTTHYGAIQGLQALGDNVSGLLILPYARLFYKMLQPELLNAANPGRRLEAEYCQGALLRACGTYVRSQIMSESELFIGITAMSTLDDLEDLFGEALHPFLLSREDFFVTAHI